jgi:pimeloyl-ACP methyl ester carboxylesterase
MARPAVALIGHSLGSAVVLNMLSDPDLRTQYADVLARVDRAVLLSAPDVAVVRLHPAFEAILNLTDTQACLGDFFGILRARVARSVLGRDPSPNQPPYEEVENLTAVLADPARRHAAQAMIRRVAPYRGLQPDWAAIEKVQAAYRTISVPVLLVCGARDEMVPVAMGYKLHADINGSILRIVTGTGHFLPSECPAVVADLIRRFIVNGDKGDAPFAEIPPPPDAPAPIPPGATNPGAGAATKPE